MSVLWPAPEVTHCPGLTTTSYARWAARCWTGHRSSLGYDPNHSDTCMQAALLALSQPHARDLMPALGEAERSALRLVLVEQWPCQASPPPPNQVQHGCTAHHQTHKQIFLMDMVWRKTPTWSWLLQRLLSGEGLSDGLSFAERQKKPKNKCLSNSSSVRKDGTLLHGEKRCILCLLSLLCIACDTQFSPPSLFSFSIHQTLLSPWASVLLIRTEEQINKISRTLCWRYCFPCLSPTQSQSKSFGEFKQILINMDIMCSSKKDGWELETVWGRVIKMTKDRTAFAKGDMQKAHVCCCTLPRASLALCIVDAILRDWISFSLKNKCLCFRSRVTCIHLLCRHEVPMSEFVAV